MNFSLETTKYSPSFSFKTEREQKEKSQHFSRLEHNFPTRENLILPKWVSKKMKSEVEIMFIYDLSKGNETPKERRDYKKSGDFKTENYQNNVPLQLNESFGSHSSSSSSSASSILEETSHNYQNNQDMGNPLVESFGCSSESSSQDPREEERRLGKIRKIKLFGEKNLKSLANRKDLNCNFESLDIEIEEILKGVLERLGHLKLEEGDKLFLKRKIKDFIGLKGTKTRNELTNLIFTDALTFKSGNQTLQTFFQILCRFYDL